jgi:Raf kinase inhibitor-like YbhB/YbcL family protein
MPDKLTVVSLAVFSLLLAGCSQNLGETAAAGTAKDANPIILTSTAFVDGQSLPDKFTCHGQDISPPLQWSGIPANSKSIAITCEDPDAPSGTFTHWIIFDIPVASNSLSENVSKTATLPDGAGQGKNSFGNIGYNGPCPPGGKTHHYIFKIYALDNSVTLNSDAGMDDLLKAIDGHVLAQGQLTGTYQD